MLLDGPREHKPSRRLVWKYVGQVVQSAFNQLGNTGNAWAIAEAQLDVDVDEEDYALAGASNFGKPLQVLTYDPTNQAHVERDVDFWEVQNMNFDWPWPNDIANQFTNWDNSPHTATRMAFFRQFGEDQIYVRVKPLPKQTATYRVIYSVGNYVDTAGLTSTPLLSNFHHLFEVQAALYLLPYAEWSDDKRDNSEKREQLAQSLSTQINEQMPDFKNYIRNLRSDKIQSRHLYGSID